MGHYPPKRKIECIGDWWVLVAKEMTLRIFVDKRNPYILSASDVPVFSDRLCFILSSYEIARDTKHWRFFAPIAWVLTQCFLIPPLCDETSVDHIKAKHIRGYVLSPCVSVTAEAQLRALSLLSFSFHHHSFVLVMKEKKTRVRERKVEGSQVFIELLFAHYVEVWGPRTLHFKTEPFFVHNLGKSDIFFGGGVRE